MGGADLYLDKIDFSRYLNPEDCSHCGLPSCDVFIESVRKGLAKTRDCTFLRGNSAYALESIEKIRGLWPEVPLLTHPRPSFVGLIELNEPKPESLVLISGNNEYTEQVLMTVLSTTVCPFFVIFVNTEGNTVDMAMIYRTLTAERIGSALRGTGIEKRSSAREIIIPGLASSLREEIEERTKWRVRAGPLCAAELPLFLSEIWIPPGKKERQER
jgi:CO dehydrogenase/acetyl-CoA synthase gamma subunit (corrinoid Fe-S protein)